MLFGSLGHNINTYQLLGGTYKMAFKSVKSYNEERFGNFFLLRNDGDYKDVVFMYRSLDDVLVADAHYIKSAEYTGYVHCCGAGCPACGKGIRVQNKLFIPVYSIADREIQFWDRNMRFENQLETDVFSRFANPSEYVFRIIRHGAAGSIDTTYEITIVGKLTGTSYDQILADNHAKFPDYYEVVCKYASVEQLSKFLSNSSSSNESYSATMPSYTVSPRPSAASYEPNYEDMPPEASYTAPDSQLESTDLTSSSVEELDDSDVEF